MQVSLKSPTVQFVKQRVTALILIPLLLWLLFHSINIYQVSHLEDVIYFLAHPISFSFIMIFIFASIYHAYLGVDDIMKDYIHSKILYRLLHLLLASICLLTVMISIINIFFYHLLFRYIAGIISNGT